MGRKIFQTFWFGSLASAADPIQSNPFKEIRFVFAFEPNVFLEFAFSTGIGVISVIRHGREQTSDEGESSDLIKLCNFAFLGAVRHSEGEFEDIPRYQGGRTEYVAVARIISARKLFASDKDW